MKELFLEQYRANHVSEISSQGCTLPEGADNRFQGVLKATVDVLMQPIDDAAVEIQNLMDVSSSDGAWLDVLAKLVGLKREPGESDSHFRTRVMARMSSRNAGTPDAVIKSASVLSGSATPQYIDEASATFLVYTGTHYDEEGVLQPGSDISLTKSQVKKMAPAGVLGLPGICIGLADGSVLGTYAENEKDRKMFLVAKEPTQVVHGVTRKLVTSDGKKIITSDGKYITAYIPFVGE